jgi:putative FmdB family regulatory protein
LIEEDLIMPIYEYECATCQKVHEIMQKFSDKPVESCPDCGKPLKKIISLSSFALKGQGWYTTDYKKSGKPPETKPKNEGSESSTSAGTSEAPTPTPTASKSGLEVSSGSTSGSSEKTSSDSGKKAESSKASTKKE